MPPPVSSVPAITLDLIRKRLSDNVFLGNGTAAALLVDGRIIIRGGDNIREPMIWAPNTTATQFAGYDPIPVTAQDEVTAAIYNWRHAAVAVSISGDEEVRNSGDSAKLSLVSAKIQVAESSLMQLIDVKLHQDFTLKSAKDFLGLDEFVEDLAKASQTQVVGGIPRSTNPWFRNQYRAGTEATMTADMTGLYIDCTEGRQSPNLGVWSPAAAEVYENQNRGKLRVQDTRMLDVGFENTMFKSVRMIMNRNTIGGTLSVVAGSVLYFLNTNYLAFYIHPDRNFAMTPWMPMPNQDARTRRIVLSGNLALSNSRFQGVLKFS